MKNSTYSFFDIQLVKTVTKTTIVMELKGIRIAATIGVNSPLKAKNIPIIL